MLVLVAVINQAHLFRVMIMFEIKLHYFDNSFFDLIIKLWNNLPDFPPFSLCTKSSFHRNQHMFNKKKISTKLKQFIFFPTLDWGRLIDLSVEAELYVSRRVQELQNNFLALCCSPQGALWYYKKKDYIELIHIHICIFK